ncbi:hypothetical protein AWB78_08355 [Caballeronia calidae]|uniref:Uncharacterized protein n=1 Tax=Caballeronia calidae TaxID=1777139 RepID=A0A158EJF2_9BURK|nr:hypothetical protein [Caballeronia calidae]SAL06988.1 hypothetical protein AWB78_08355 [Caballeronia calidae]
MTVQQILALIQQDADSFSLAASDALPAYAEILAEVVGHVTPDDFTALIAIGSVLRRNADAEQMTQDLLTRHRYSAIRASSATSSHF